MAFIIDHLSTRHLNKNIMDLKPCKQFLTMSSLLKPYLYIFAKQFNTKDKNYHYSSISHWRLQFQKLAKPFQTERKFF